MWETCWEARFMVSPGALSSGPAAGRDQTWAVFGKGHWQAGRWDVSAGKQESPVWLFKCWECWRHASKTSRETHLAWNVYAHSRFVLSADCVWWPQGLKPALQTPSAAHFCSVSGHIFLFLGHSFFFFFFRGSLFFKTILSPWVCEYHWWHWILQYWTNLSQIECLALSAREGLW